MCDSKIAQNLSRRGGKVKRTRDRRWPWIELGVLVLALGIVGLWCWWLAGGARLAHDYAVAGLAGTPGGAASAPTLDQLGHSGDLFGGLNALFAALAFVGVVWAGSLQRRTLLDTQAAYELERDALARQQFESTFFQLLPLVRDLSRGQAGVAVAMAPTSEISGDALLHHLAAVLFARASTAEFGDEAAVVSVLRDMVQTYESEVLVEHSSMLGAYFRALYQLLSLIDRQSELVLDPQEKVRYANIVRGQIPESLLLMLAVSSLTRRGESFNSLIVRYGLLKHLQPQHRDALRPAFERVFGAQAFLGRQEREQLANLPPDPLVVGRILTLIREEPPS